MSATNTAAIPFEDGRFYSDNPFPTLARLRAEEPVYFREDLNTWFLTRFEDVVQVSRNAMVFSSASGVLLQQLISSDGSTGYFKVDTVATTDPPKHGALRRMVAPAFMPRRVAAIEVEVREVCRKLVAELPAETEIDFLHTVAEVVPLVVIAKILGVQDYNVADIARWSLEIVRIAQNLTPEEKAASRATFGQLLAYVSEQIALKRTNPSDDLLSTLIAVEPPLPEDDMLAWATLMMSAGHETTQSLIGNIADVMDQHPDQLAAVSADPGKISAMIDETLRWRGVVTGFGRRVKSDVTVGGQEIRAGASVFMLYLSANRDEAVFANPEVFDINAPRSQENLAFGIGNHFCPGHAVARMETRVLYEELFKRFKGWTVTSRQRLVSPLRLGNAHLKVKFHER
jgi:cytochrome P450